MTPNRDANNQAARAEPALWQYRWTNPGRSEHVSAEQMAWHEVKPWDPNVQTLEQRIEELRAFRYEGVPAYEVRALYATPTSPHEAETPAAADELRAAFNAWVRQQTGSLFSPGAQSSDFYFRIWLAGRSSADLASHPAAPVEAETPSREAPSDDILRAGVRAFQKRAQRL